MKHALSALLIALFLAAVGGAVAGEAPAPGLSVAMDGSLQLNGRAFRGLGVNYYDAFVRTLTNPGRTNYESGFAELAKRHIPFARFSAGAYWPAEWGLYRTNRAEYFARFDALVRSAKRHGVGLIPSLFWQSSTVPDLVGEPCSRWGDPGSQTLVFMREYTREVVSRYRDSPAIWAWEFGNEYNLPADLPNAAEHRPPIVPSLGTPAVRSERDDLTHDAIRMAVHEFAREVRRWDSHRPIISGHAFPRVSAWHQWKQRTWEHDTPDQFEEMLLGDNPEPINTLSVRAYELANDVGRLGAAMKVARKSGKPLFVGEFGVPAGAGASATNSFRQILQSLESNQIPLAALWVFDFDGQAADWNVTGTNGRAWQLDEIERANSRLRSR